jgi:TonB family protein
VDAEQTRIELGPAAWRPLKPRALAFGGSILVHLLAILAIVSVGRATGHRGSRWIVAYLVDGAGGGSHVGIQRAKRPMATARAPGSRLKTRRSAIAIPARKPRKDRANKDVYVAAARAKRAAPSAPAKTLPASLRGGAVGLSETHGGATSGAGTEDIEGPSRGTGGEAGSADGEDGAGQGASLAYARYAKNPAPDYPAEARLRGEEGTVVVRVLVAADGSVRWVEIAKSSGFDLLDQQALRTVRTRWRFVAARRKGVAVDSWVLVPIRFVLR